MLGRERPEAVLPDRALYLPTFCHFLIANKTSLASLTLSVLHTSKAHQRNTSKAHTCAQNRETNCQLSMFFVVFVFCFDFVIANSPPKTLLAPSKRLSAK